MHHSWPQNNKSGIIMQPDIVMFCVSRPSSEVVKEGRILPAGLAVIPTKHHQFNPGLYLVNSGTFFRVGKAKGRQRMISQIKTLKHIPG